MTGVNMETFPQLTVKDCWVVGLERFAVGAAGEEEEFFEIRIEWFEKSITYLRRRYYDLVKLVKNLSISFPDDRGRLSQPMMLKALQRIKEAEENNNVKTRLDEVEKLLRNIIKMPQKFSHSEAVLTFFKTSPLDYTLKSLYEPIQPLYQSSVTVADVRRANGFCLANTETVLFDPYLLAQGAEPSSKYSSEVESQMWTGMRNGIRCIKETVHKPGKCLKTAGTPESKDTDHQPKISQITTSNMTYLDLQACETDILE
ncbi:PX domain-containing protein 1-like [Sinocyclocheilus anshuiensis]|uniref:PX domain-containing protein 1-like n=1 Tax=Sinocyclocheilus anshuiensis TaxID=1608454 RepID=UPI0007B8369B|nr:PREDICTED: PX domain-containing protein 1-like [Sinocyclocheilus anshuiensis]